MPKLNRKLFVALLVFVAVLAGSLFLIHSVQSSRTADALLWQAEHHAEQGKIQKATHYLRQYLELKPDDIESIIRLCELMEENGITGNQTGQMLFLYEKVLRTDADHETARCKAIDICLNMGRHHDAQAHLDHLLPKHPKDGALWRQFALCRLASDDFAKAAEALTKAITFTPDDVRAYELLAALQVSNLRDTPAAKKTLDAMVEANATDPEALLVRARYARSVNDLNGCEADLRQLFLFDPENVEGILMICELMQGRGDIHGVRVALSEAIELHHKDVRLYRSLSWLELNAGNRPAAVACLRKGIEKLPDANDLITPLADLLVQDGEIKLAEELLAKLEARQAEGNQSQLGYLKARLAMGRHEWRKAIALLENLRSEAVELPGLAAQVNLLLSVCYHQRADNSNELMALRRVLDIDPRNLSARMSVANLHLNAGRLDEAITEYTAVVASPYAPLDAQILLGRLRIGHARFKGASEAEWEQVATFVRNIRQRYPDSPAPVLLQGEVLKARGKHAEADSVLREAVAAAPSEAALWSELAELRRDVYGNEAAFEILDEAQALVGERIEFRLSRARLWAEGFGPNQLESVQLAERGIERFAEPDQVRLLYGLADLYDGLREQDALHRVYRAIAERKPDDTHVRLELVELARTAGDTAAVERLRKEIAALGEAGRVALACIDSDKDQLNKLAKDEPADTRVRAALGRLAEADGDTNAAAKHFAAAYDLDRSRLARLRELVAFLARHNRDQDVRQRLAELYRDPRVEPSRFRTLFASATAELSNQRFEECAEWIKPMTDVDPMSRVWLGDLSVRRGMTDAATEHYRAAVKMAPIRPEPYLRLARLAADADDTDAITAVYTSAMGAMSKPSHAMLAANMTVLIREMGKQMWSPPFQGNDSDKSLYARAVLRLLMRREQVVEAKEFLQGFLAEAQSTEDTIWATRNLALLRAIEGTPEERREAIAQLRQLAASGGASDEDRRAQAAVLSVAYRHLEGDQRQDVMNAAIGSMKSITEGSDPRPGDVFRLAQMYRKTGQSEAFVKSLGSLAEKDPSNPSYVTAYLNALLDENRLEEAQPWAARLQRDHAGEFPSLQVLVKYHHLNNEPTRAMELAERYFRAVEAGSNEAPQRLRRIGELFDEVSKLGGPQRNRSRAMLADAAIRHYEACLSGQPDAAILLASLLARMDRAEEGFTQLVRIGSRISDRARIAGGLDLLRSGRATPHHQTEIRRWVDEALSRRPNSMALRLSLGEYFTLINDFTEAEKAFRAALELDPDNVVALNNLAWVMAPDQTRAAQALEHIEKALQISGRNSELLDTRARALLTRGAEGDYDRAVADLTEALGEGQTSLRYFHLAVAKLKQSDTNEAVDAFRKAEAHGLEKRMVHPADMPAYQTLRSRLGT